MVAVNLLILYFVLRKILFKPVTEFMENRTKSIRDSIEDAEKQKAEAEQLRLRYEEHLKNARDEGVKIVNEAILKAEREHERLIEQAKQQAEALLISAREKINYEHEQMLMDVHGQVAELALAAASKVMEANMNIESNRVLVDKFLDEAGAA